MFTGRVRAREAQPNAAPSEAECLFQIRSAVSGWAAKISAQAAAIHESSSGRGRPCGGDVSVATPDGRVRAGEPERHCRRLRSMALPGWVRRLFRRDPVFQQKVNSFQLRYMYAVAAVIFIAIILIQLGPSLRARFGHGTAGTFTVQELDCRDDCRWYGEFISDDGRRHRYDVYLVDAGRSDLNEGAWVAAIDTGAPGRVYPPAGSSEWWWWVIALAASGVMTVQSALAWRRWLRDRRG